MDRNTSIGILFGVGIVVVLAFGLAMFPAQSEDTIILVNKNGNDPVNSCAPNNGLILAQNLTDLCDVVIISPTTNQIIRYNGSFWVNVAQTTFNDTTTCNNIGIGSAFVCIEGSNVNLRSILNGTGIIVSNDTNTITVTNSLPDNTACANVGTGSNVYKDGECNFRSILGSSDISVTQQNNTVTIDYNGTYIKNVVTVTTDATLTAVNDIIICDTNSGAILLTLPNNLQGKEYTVKTPNIPSSNTCTLQIAGAGTFDDDNDFLVLNKDWESVTVVGVSAGVWRGVSTQAECNNLGSVGISVCSPDTDIPLVNFLKLLAGTSISLSSNGTRITITNTDPDNTVCANVGSATAIYKDGECNFKTLVGSPDISVTNTTNTVVIDYNGTHVTQVTSNNNNTIGVVPTTGNVVLYPKYQLLCQTTLASANATISCNGFSARSNLIININAISNGGTGVEPALRFNGDSGTNYAVRISANGGADSTITNTSRCNIGSNGALSATTDTIRSEMQFNNFSTSRKIGYGFKAVGSDTADTTAPSKVEIACKWDNTTAQITSVTLISFSGTGNYNTGSQLTVWGYN